MTEPKVAAPLHADALYCLQFLIDSRRSYWGILSVYDTRIRHTRHCVYSLCALHAFGTLGTLCILSVCDTRIRNTRHCVYSLSVRYTHSEHSALRVFTQCAIHALGTLVTSFTGCSIHASFDFKVETSGSATLLFFIKVY